MRDTVHYATEKHRRNFTTACGLYTAAVLDTDKPDRVTCRNCLRVMAKEKETER
jgi:hypothetical protein